MSDDDKQDETSGRQRSDETEREREHTPLPGPRAVSREFSQGTGFMRVGTDEHMPTTLGDELSETRGWTRRDENEPNEEKQMNIQEHEAADGMIPISNNDLVEVVEAGIEQREQEEFTQQQEVAVSDDSNEYEGADATEQWEPVEEQTQRGGFNIHQGMENMDQPAPEGVDSRPKPPPFRQPTGPQLATTPSEAENMFSAENVEVSEDISEPVGVESDQDDVPEIPADAIQAADDENDEPEETPAQQENPPIVGESTTEPTETGDGNGGNGGGGSSSGGGSGGSGNTRQTGLNRAVILMALLFIAALLFGAYKFLSADDPDTTTQVAQKSEPKSNVKTEKPDDKEVVEKEPEEETDEIAFGDDEVADVPSSEETDDTEDETEVTKLRCKYVSAEDDPGAPRTIEGWFVIECDNGQMKKGKPVFNDRGKVVRLDPIEPCVEEECKQLHL